MSRSCSAWNFLGSLAYFFCSLSSSGLRSDIDLLKRCMLICDRLVRGCSSARTMHTRMMIDTPQSPTTDSIIDRKLMRKFASHWKVHTAQQLDIWYRISRCIERAE